MRCRKSQGYFGFRPSHENANISAHHQADQAFMSSFERDGVYASIPYRVLPDGSIMAMTPGGLAKFRNIDQFMASANGSSNQAHAQTSFDLLRIANDQAPTVPAKSTDYYSILKQTIKNTEQDSAQLRALIYERARFNFKRDLLFGHSSLGLTDLIQHVKDFELAVARIEANSTGINHQPIDYQTKSAPEEKRPSTSVEPVARQDSASSPSKNAVQVLPPRPPSPYVKPAQIQRMTKSEHDLRLDELVPQVRFANQLIGILALAIVFIGTVIVAGLLWHSPRVATQIETAKNLPKPTAAKVTKLPYPLPTSYGIYVLNDNKLAELKPLRINVPDPRVALSAEIKQPTTTIISDNKPAFILFRRDLVNSAPQKLTIRVIARMERETAIVGGKAQATPVEGIWRIRNISRDYRVSPVPGQREMVIARPVDDQPLAAGRYALVLNRIGYDFTIKGPVKSAAFCLEQFQTANGLIYNQCRAP